MIDEYIWKKFFDKTKINKNIMVEVGAAKPDFLSQSKYFREKGWRCLCIEPNPLFAEMHRMVCNEIYEYACSYFDGDDIDFEIVNVENGFITYESFSSLMINDNLLYVSGYPPKDKLNIKKIKVKVRKLNTILNEAGIFKIDYLTVDVEGFELDVMSGFSIEKYTPKVVVLENNLPYMQIEYDDYMHKYGYDLDSIIDNNSIYIKQS